MPRLGTFPFTEEPASVGDYSIDFGPQIPPGATLVSTVWQIETAFTLPGSVVDYDPASHLNGSSSIIGTVSVQQIQGLVAGNNYTVTATGTMSDGEVVVLWTSPLRCRAPGQG
jgi:hypothetical protein